MVTPLIGQIVTVITNPHGDNDKKRTGKVFGFNSQGWPCIEIEPNHVACGPLFAIKANSEDAGCYVDGHWGQYGIAHMIERATEFGYSDQEVIDLANKKLRSMGPNTMNHPYLTDSEEDILYWMADEVEEWLNENVAEEGYSFYWNDGEFFYSKNDEEGEK